MNCKKVRDLIMTDYADAQLSERGKKKIGRHIAHCPACSEYEKIARETAILPFARAKAGEVPESVWFNVQSAIARKQIVYCKAPVAFRLPVFSFRRALGYAVLTIVLFAAVYFGISRGPEKDVTPGDFFSVYAIEDMVAQYDLGTDIERYFL